MGAEINEGITAMEAQVVLPRMKAVVVLAV